MPVIKDPEENETAHLSSIKELAGARVLEIGCGDGRMTWRYADIPQSIVAFDPDASLLAAAAADYPAGLRESVKFIQATVEAIPFADRFFDAAILAWSL